jgi:hypothetical protein
MRERLWRWRISDDIDFKCDLGGFGHSSAIEQRYDGIGSAFLPRRWSHRGGDRPDE